MPPRSTKPRAARAKSEAVEVQQVRMGVDERNIAELPIILAQSKIMVRGAKGEPSRPLQALRREFFTPDGRTVEMALDGVAKGLPHGLDNDIWVAIQQLYVLQGQPEDGVIRTTLHEMLTTAHLDTSSRYYKVALDALIRLKGTVCTISSGWVDIGKAKLPQRRVGFSLINEYEYRARGEQEGSREHSLVLTLNKHVVTSIHNVFVKPLNLDVYQSLSQPMTRTVYRHLDAKLYALQEQPNKPRIGTHFSFSQNLIDWCASCGFLELEAHALLRQLTPAHTELITRGFLKSVDVVGRGKQARITYTFSQQVQVLDDRLVSQLRDYGLKEKEAERWVARLGERAGAAVRALDAQMQLVNSGKARPIGNKAGYLVTLLQDEESRSLEERRPLPPTAAPPPKQVKERAVGLQPTLTETLLTPQLPTATLKSAFFRRQLSTLLNDDQLTQVTARAEADEVLAAQILRDALSALASKNPAELLQWIQLSGD